MNPAGKPPPDRRPQVSVIIPVYNFGRFLPAAVASAVSQDGVEPQVIIVDDHSTDDSANIAERLARGDPRVSVVRLPRNYGQGGAGAFNQAYPLATGEFISKLDADDLLAPGSLARAAALFDAFPDVGLVYGHPRHFNDDAIPARHSARPQVRSWTVWSGPDWIAERCRRGVNCITTPEAIVRAKVMESVGIFSSEIEYATDIHLWLRIAAVTDVGRVDGVDQAFHREHAASVTGKAAYTDMVDLTQRKIVFDDFFAGAGKDLSNAAELYSTVSATLASEALLQACRAYDRGRTGSVDVAGYVDFAFRTYSAAGCLPQWRALRRRQMLGERLSAMPPFFTASQAARRVRTRMRYRHWQRTGV